MCPSCLLTQSLDGEDHDDGPAFWEDMPGKKLSPLRTFSHFELLDELGRGGMGVVYRARDLNTERIVAVKVLQAHHLDVPDLVQRFRSEVRAVSSLDHPYVLPIHEVGEQDGIPFFSMKLTTAGSLAQSIGNYRGKPRESAQLLAKVSRGVQHAHERGILHRDLKPGNILLDAAGEPYVCDFGLAKWIESDQKLTVTSAVLGTPHYIAPEQALGSKALTTAVDIYSLGAILYELLTGRPPFLGATVLETLVASQEKSPDRPSSIAKNVPADLETICLKALEHDPSARYATAGAFADDLENWLAGRTINARPVNAAEQLWRWAKRNPLPALLVVALIATLATIAVGQTIAAIRLAKETKRAVAAENEAVMAKARSEEQLYQSLLAQSKASRLTGEAGQRFHSLQVIKHAAQIKRTTELRNEAIAALSLLDLRIINQWQIRRNPTKEPLRYNQELSRIVVGGSNGDIRVIRLSDRFIEHILPGTNDPLVQLYYKGGKYGAARYGNELIVVWDFDSGEKLFTLKSPREGTPVTRFSADISFSNDNKLMAVVNPTKQLEIYNISERRLRLKLPQSTAGSVACFSPDAKRIAVYTATSELQIWELGDSSPTLMASCLSPRVLSIDWSSELIAAGCSDYRIYVYRAGDMKLQTTLEGHKQDVTQVLFHPTGDTIASTSRDDTVRIWDIRSRSEMVFISGVGVEPNLRFSENGDRLGTSDYVTDAVILAFSDGGGILTAIAPPEIGDFATLVSSIDFDNGGSLLATASHKAVTLFDTRSYRTVCSEVSEKTEEHTLQFLNDNSLLVTERSKPPEIWKLKRRNNNLAVEDRKPIDIGTGFILGTANFDKQFTTFTSLNDGRIVVLDTSTLRVLHEYEGHKQVWDAIAGPNGQWVAASCSNRGSDVAQVLGFPFAINLAAGAGGVLAMSPDFKSIITTGINGGILWSTDSWLPGKSLPPEVDAKHISTATFSPEGKLLAVGVGKLIWLIDIKTGTALGALSSRTLESREYRLRFSRDGQILAAQGEDNSVRIWNLKNLYASLEALQLDW